MNNRQWVALRSKESKFKIEGVNYDPSTGRIWWVADGIAKRGSNRVTRSSRSYLHVCRHGIIIAAHRVAWRIYYGKWPTGEIDHINGIHSDNRIANLRDSSHGQNAKNVMPRKLGPSGERGVQFHGARWRVKVSSDKREYLYYASHKISAILASRLIRRTLHGEFFHQPQMEAA